MIIFRVHYFSVLLCSLFIVCVCTAEEKKSDVDVQTSTGGPSPRFSTLDREPAFGYITKEEPPSIFTEREEPGIHTYKQESYVYTGREEPSYQKPIQNPREDAITRTAKADGLFFGVLGKHFKSEEELVQLGNDFLKLHRYKEALEMFTKAIKKNPCVEYYMQRVKCNIFIRDFEAILHDYKKVLAATAYSDKKVITDTELFNLGRRLTEINKYGGAIWCFTEAIRINPQEMSYYKRRGECYMFLRNADSSIADFKTVLHFDPQDKETRYLFFKTLIFFEKYEQLLNESQTLADSEFPLEANELARIAGDLRQSKKSLTEAAHFYSEAIKKSPENAEYYASRGTCYLQQEKYTEARIDFMKALELDTYVQGIRHHLQTIFKQAEQLNEAVEAIIQTEKPFVGNVKLLATELQAQNKVDEALRLYTEVIKKNPEDASYYRLRSNFYSQLDDVDMAVQDLRKVLELEPNSDKDRNRLIDELFEAKRYKDAIEESLRVEKPNPESVKRLGRGLLEESQFDEALLLYSEAIKKDPSQLTFYRLRSDCHAEMKNMDMAIQDLRELLKLDPNSRNNRVHLSEVLFNCEKYNEAVEEIIVSNESDDIAQLAALFLKNKKFDEAIRCYTEAITKNPYKEAYYEKRGVAHWKLKKNDEAILDFVKTLEFSPQNTLILIDMCEILTEVGRYKEADNGLQLAQRNIDNAESRSNVKSKVEVAKLEFARERLEKKTQAMQIDVQTPTQDNQNVEEAEKVSVPNSPSVVPNPQEVANPQEVINPPVVPNPQAEQP